MPEIEAPFLFTQIVLAAIFCVWSVYAGVSIRRLPTVARYEAFLLYCCMTAPIVGVAGLADLNWIVLLVLMFLCWPPSVMYADRQLRIGVLGRAGYFRLLARHSGSVEVIRDLDDLSRIEVLVVTPEQLDELSNHEGSHGELYKAVVTNEVDVRLLADYLEHSFGCSNVGKPLKETAANLYRFTMFELAKLITEKVIAVTLLITLSPLFLVVALLIWGIDGRPLIYRQPRLGRGGKPFKILKFRTMQDLEEEDRPQITRLGGYLRYFHLDELPQLINILRGEMAFVGPRPEWVLLTDDAQAPEDYWLRLAVKPGLTGWAQVNYKPTYTKRMRERKLGYDVYYINNRTFFMVSLIWMRTLWMLFLALFGKARGRSLDESRDPKSQ
ncbi:MAG: sugar transferase [Ahrensia sp.]|nr:sugar transferase [Ahrensia sp.]